MEYERDHRESLVTAIPWALCSFLERDPTDLDPMFQVVDLESLDGLFDAAEAADVRVQFHYEGCTVAVTSRCIRVEETAPEKEPPSRPM